MNVRKATPEDLPRMGEVYACAREAMKRSGNPRQWGDTRPSPEAVAEDVARGNSYVLEAGGRICGVFAFVLGDDPTYAVIEGGAWKSAAPYGTIHRLASDGTERGVFRACLDHCAGICPHIRIDTHRDNRIMQRLLAECGFARCGIIYVDDGTPRIAYERLG